MPYIRPSIAQAQPLLIKQIAAETARLVETEGAVILSLAQGTPNLPLFPAAVDAMAAHVASARMPYTDVAGMMEVRETAAQFVNSSYALPAHARSVAASDVIITAGAAQSVYNCLALSVGCVEDVVLSPLPAYGLYLHQTNVLGGTFDAVQTDAVRDFKPTVEQLQAAFDKHTVTDLVLCFPNNPCGTTLDESEARSIASFLDAKLAQFPDADFSVVLDEVYIGISSPAAHHSVLSYASERLLRNCFLVLSVSKGLGAMPGARGGFLTTFDSRVVPELVKIQMACTANASSVSQIGLGASLRHIMSTPSALADVHSYYSARTSLCVRRLNDIGSKYLGGARVAKQPQGTFYVMADFSAWKGGDLVDDRSIQRLLRDQYKLAAGKVGVACVPGCAFDLRPELKLVRFSCAVEMDVLEKAMDIIEETVRGHCEKYPQQQQQ